MKFTDHVTYTGQSSTVKEGHAIDMSWASSASGSYWVRRRERRGQWRKEDKGKGSLRLLNTVSIFSLVILVICQRTFSILSPSFLVGEKGGEGE